MLELARDYMENVFPGIVHTLYEGFTENNDEKIILKDPNCKALSPTNPFLININELPQIKESNARNTHLLLILSIPS